MPWDSLAPDKSRARAHLCELADRSVGSPVDPTLDVVRAALVAASDAHGYPQTRGTPALREAVASWFDRRRGFGFIQPDDGALEVFVHIAEVRSSGLTLLEDGQRVAYSLALGNQGGTSAVNLKPL